MSSTSEDIKDVLVTAVIGTFAGTSGWSIYIGEMPDIPDTVVCLYDRGGDDSNPKWLVDTPTLQVRVRGAVDDYTGGFTKVQAVKDALLGYGSHTVNGTVYVGIWLVGDINFVTRDDKRRPIFTLNFRIVREPASGTYRTAL